MTPEEMWRALTAHTPVAAGYEAWHFHDNQEDADHLAQLVLEGKKRGTASCSYAYVKEDDPFPKADEYSVITDWAGEAQCVIQTLRVEIVPWREVSGKYAALEGEGDLSLDYWRRAHKPFFIQECERCGQSFTTEMPVVCEEFKLVWPPDRVTERDKRL